MVAESRRNASAGDVRETVRDVEWLVGVSGRGKVCSGRGRSRETRSSVAHRQRVVR